MKPRDANDVLREEGPDGLRDAIDKAARKKKASEHAPGKDNGEAPPQLVRLDLARYDTEPIPEREWGVRDRFPRRTVALLSGEGSVGKSILFLQLAAAHVLPRDWLRSMPEPGPVLLVNCEDEGDELVRRLEPILKNYHAKFSEVAVGLHAFSLADRDPLLAVPDRYGRILSTPLYAELLEQARAVQPICTVIDNVADVYGGSEIDRSQVRQFVALMRQIAIAANGYVIMSAHPSQSGIASKTGLSGSTQWHNSVRARAYMHMNTEKRRPAEHHRHPRARIHEKSITARCPSGSSCNGRTASICPCGPRPRRNKRRETPQQTRCSCNCSTSTRAPAEREPEADRQQFRAERVRQDGGSKGGTFRARSFRGCARPPDRSRPDRQRAIRRALQAHEPDRQEAQVKLRASSRICAQAVCRCPVSAFGAGFPHLPASLSKGRHLRQRRKVLCDRYFSRFRAPSRMLRAPCARTPPIPLPHAGRHAGKGGYGAATPKATEKPRETDRREKRCR